MLGVLLLFVVAAAHGGSSTPTSDTPEFSMCGRLNSTTCLGLPCCESRDLGPSCCPFGDGVCCPPPTLSYGTADHLLASQQRCCPKEFPVCPSPAMPNYNGVCTSVVGDRGPFPTSTVSTAPPSPLPHGRYLSAAIVWHGTVYLFGGRNITSNEGERDVAVYQPYSRRWSSLGASMPRPRVDLYAVVDPTHDDVYVFGGGESTVASTLDILHMPTRKWRSGPSLSLGTGQVVLAGALFPNTHQVVAVVSEGVSDSTIRLRPFLLDATPNGTQWSTSASRSPLFTASNVYRQVVTSAQLDGSLYLVTQHDYETVSSTMQVYNAVHDRWSTVSGMGLSDLVMFSAIALDDTENIGFFGGCQCGSSCSATGSVAVYNVHRQSMTALPSLLRVRCAPSPVLVEDGVVFVVAGTTDGPAETRRDVEMYFFSNT